MTKTESMVSWIRDEWARAVVNSRRYRIGRQFLCRRSAINGIEHDVLGVLCEIAVAYKVIDEGNWISPGEEGFLPHKRFGAAQESGVLPMEVVEWAALQSQNPTIALSVKQRDELKVPPFYSSMASPPRRIPLSKLNDYSEATPESLARFIGQL